MKNCVEIGDTVYLYNTVTNKIEKITIIPTYTTYVPDSLSSKRGSDFGKIIYKKELLSESNIEEGEILSESPIAKKLIGAALNSFVTLIDDNLNEINYKIVDIKNKNDSITDNDIIVGLINGYDPFTGKKFNENHILNNPRVKDIMNRIQLYDKYSADDVTYDCLNYEQRLLFDKIKAWRLDKMQEMGTRAYVILHDQTIINIICADIKEKQDLLQIKGFGLDKYQKYGDDIYKIITEK